MKNFVLLLLASIIQLTFGQKMENTFFTWEAFSNNFGKEMVSAKNVYNQMVKSGLTDNSLGKFDVHFISDRKENLENLSHYIKEHYPYQIESLKQNEDSLWELHAITNEIPVTNDNLLYWTLDMYKRGYEFDSRLDGYGAPFDHDNPKFPNLENSKEDFYFNLGVDSYNSGDLSGAIIYWTLVLTINPNEPNSYYSRAIVKNELYTWKSALRDYDKAIEIAPDFISALTNRGSIKDVNGDFEGAISDYNSALKIKNIDLENKQMLTYNKGNTKLNMGDKIGACEDWNKALKLGAQYAKDRINQYCKI